MFGPSDWPIDGPVGQNHRSPAFHVLLRELEARWKEAFCIPDDWVILFLSGSGTLANEVVCRAFRPKVLTRPGGVFDQRLAALAEPWGYSGNCLAFVHYDTAVSRVWPGEFQAGWIVADMVSAFPYYQPLPTVDVWTTVNCKQLGGPPVMSVICLSPRALAKERLMDDSESMLSLDSYLRWRERRETPHTPSIPLYIDLLDRVSRFDVEGLRRRVSGRRQELESVVPSQFHVGTGPVFTFTPEAIPAQFAARWGLYRGRFGFQVFLYSGDDRAFDNLLGELEGLQWPS